MEQKIRYMDGFERDERLREKGAKGATLV